MAIRAPDGANKDIILNQIILSVDTLLLAQGFRGPYIRDKDVAASKSPKAASYPPAFRARMQIQNITKIEKEESCSVLVPCQPMAAPVVLESVLCATLRWTNMLRSQLDNIQH